MDNENKLYKFTCVKHKLSNKPCDTCHEKARYINQITLKNSKEKPLFSIYYSKFIKTSNMSSSNKDIHNNDNSNIKSSRNNRSKGYDISNNVSNNKVKNENRDCNAYENTSNIVSIILFVILIISITMNIYLLSYKNSDKIVVEKSNDSKIIFEEKTDALIKANIELTNQLEKYKFDLQEVLYSLISSKEKQLGGENFFLWIVRKNFKDLMIDMLTKNKDAIFEKDNYDNTALHMAASHGNCDILEILITYRENIDAKNKFGWTPLHVAAKEGHLDCVKALIFAKSNINEKDSVGNTPLHHAVKEHRESTVEYLVSHGSNLYIRNNFSENAKDIAIGKLKSLLEGLMY